MSTSTAAPVRCACIDIGSNTTRLLVAEPGAAGGGPAVRELAADRVFTAIGAAAEPDGTLPEAKIDEVAAVVAAQAAVARSWGVGAALRAVGTAAVRRAPNREALATALGRVGVSLDVLSGEQEARLAFAGAIASLPVPPVGLVAVVDVGGGSTEVAAGLAGSGPSWWASLAVGSSSLTARCVRSEPPTPACLARLRDAARDSFAAISPPVGVSLVLAVGGSATSLALLAGVDASAGCATIDDGSLRRVAVALGAVALDAGAARLVLDPRRLRVLPAGIALLERASLFFSQPLRIVRGGLREGVILELLDSGQ